MLKREVGRRDPWDMRWLGWAVAALVSFLMVGAVVAPRVMKCYGESKRDVARATVRKYAFEAYPSWLAAHPDRECPDALAELNEYMHNRDTRDVWGNDYVMLCGRRGSPVRARGFVVLSAGEDGRLGTADDVYSSL